MELGKKGRGGGEGGGGVWNGQKGQLIKRRGNETRSRGTAGGGRGVGWRWKEREGLTLRGGLRRRVTINDCEIRIRGGRVSMQWGKKMSIRQQEGKRGDERGIPWRDFREKWNARWKGWGYGREHSVIFYWCRETGRCEGRSGTEDRGDLRREKKAKMEWGKAWRLAGNKRRNTDDVKWHFLGERKEWDNRRMCERVTQVVWSTF